MSFDSPLFLACFLPLLVVLYWLIPVRRGRNWLLLLAGLLFYAFGSLQGLGLLLLSAVINYAFGLLLLRFPGKKAICGAGVTANLLFLAVYQYLDFVLGEILGLPQLKLGLAAPVGISFFTFKAISYLVDTFRDPQKGTKRFFDFLLYLSFFPQVMSGPIARFAEFSPQLTSRERKDMAPGLRRFIVGLTKKMFFSGVLAQAVSKAFAFDGADIRLAWLGACAYMLQIYFDFSGYSDMAIGLGQMFGFSTPENFLYPYIAGSITEFWRRWHISLSTWFKDYLYIPLGGNRKGKARTALNKFLVFALCGIWHGAAWTFLLWGVWHGLLSALESFGILKPKNWWKPLRHIYTLLMVCLGFVLFRADTIAQGFRVIGAMFAGFSFTQAGTVTLHGILTGEFLCAFLLGAVLCLPWAQAIRERPKLWRVAQPLSYVGCLMLFVFCLLRMSAGGFAPFIYFQF